MPEDAANGNACKYLEVVIQQVQCLEYERMIIHFWVLFKFPQFMQNGVCF